MADVQIGFVSGLKAEKSVTKNLLTSLYNVQTPVGGIIEWNTLKMRVRTGVVKHGTVNLEPTKEPIDVDQCTNIGHHVKDLWGVH